MSGGEGSSSRTAERERGRHPKSAREPIQGLTPIACRGARFRGRSGFIDDRAQEFVIRTLGRELVPAALGGLVVATRDGVPVLLSSVAEVGFGARPRRGSAGFGGEPAVILGIQKQPGVDSLALTRELERTLASIRSTLPPVSMPSASRPHRRSSLSCAAIFSPGMVTRVSATLPLASAVDSAGLE